MSSTKLVTVYGATGQQGISVINSLLENTTEEFAIRAVTRNPESEKGKEFAARGVEVVKGDGFNKNEMETAFQGSWAVFVNTNSSDPALHQQDGMVERDLGKIIVDAAFDVGVQHFIYSGLVSASLATNGEVPSSSFDEKSAIGEYAKSKGFKSTVIVSSGWYMENHINPEFAELMGGFPLNADTEGYFTLHIPRMGGNNEIPFVAIEADYGDLVHGVLLQPEGYNGQLIQAASELAQPDKFVAEFHRLTGKKSRFVPLEDWKTIETYGSPDIEALKTMYGFCQYVDGKYYAVPSDLSRARELKAKANTAKGLRADEYPLLTLEKFIQKHLLL